MGEEQTGGHDHATPTGEKRHRQQPASHQDTTSDLLAISGESGSAEASLSHATTPLSGQPRELFRVMVLAEIEDSPLTWSRRRGLIRFARRIGIDEFEAGLIIRAVEYHCGHIALAATDASKTTVERQYLAEMEPSGDTWGSVALLVLWILAACGALASF